MLTPQYAAPERLEDLAPGPAADVYALGATLFALHTGQPPFATNENSAPAAVMMRVLNEAAPLHELPETTNQRVREAIGLAMSRSVDERPSAIEFASMLRMAAEETVPRVVSDARTVPLSGAIVGAQRETANRRPLLLGVFALIAIAVFGTVFALSGGSDEITNVQVEGATEEATTDSAVDELAEIEATDATMSTTEEVPETTSSTSTTISSTVATTTIAAQIDESTATTAAPETTTTSSAAPTTTAAPETTTTSSAAPETTTTSSAAPTTTTTAAPIVPALLPPAGLREWRQGHRNGRQFITVTWELPANADSADVSRNGEIVSVSDDNEFFSDETVFSIGQSVTYRVRSAQGNETSAWSDPITIVFNEPFPEVEPPTSLRSDAQGNRNAAKFITVRWSAPAGAVVDVESDGRIVQNGDDNNVFSDEAPFSQGQSVTYRVRSVRDGQTSVWSAPISVPFTTPPRA